MASKYIYPITSGDNTEQQDRPGIAAVRCWVA
jgi:hypothetical protein